MGTLIAIVVLVVIIIFGLKLLKDIFGVLKFNFGQFNEAQKQEEKIETQNADAILYRYAKGNKIPSWAYDRAVKELKAYCGRAKQITYATYMADQKLEVVPLTETYKLEPGVAPRDLTLACMMRLRQFDLETYGSTGKLLPKDQEVMDNLIKMWFFAETNCPDMQSAELQLKILLKSMVPEEYHTAEPKVTLNERGKPGPRYSVKE